MTKSRFAYILLAVFTGIFGIHNFYAGYTGRAIMQLLITVLSVGCLAPLTWLWAIIEACVVKQDAKGGLLQSESTRSRLAYIVLALSFGIFGMHNFYAGNTRKAIVQILITILSLGYLGIFVWIWALVELCSVTQDAQGGDFTS